VNQTGAPKGKNDKEDATIYKVVVNHEEQYSIWPSDRENPHGWKDGGKTGPKDKCLAHVKTIWTDMRPLSLRKKTGKERYAPR
jgi:MbtH protein